MCSPSSGGEHTVTASPVPIMGYLADPLSACREPRDVARAKPGPLVLAIALPRRYGSAMAVRARSALSVRTGHHRQRVAVGAERAAGCVGESPFPGKAASLLPGLLAATRTGLPPAGDDELTNPKKHHGIKSRCHLPFCWAHEKRLIVHADHILNSGLISCSFGLELKTEGGFLKNSEVFFSCW
jgi:hypothetical protein